MAARPSDLEVQFTNAMFDIYEEARKLDPPYKPTAFRSMVAEHEGKGAADRLLEGSTPSSGFAELLLRGKEALKLSVEYLVLTDPWRELFSEDQLQVARSRLSKVECELPEDDLQPRFQDIPLPEEVPDGSSYVEGAVRRIEINAYERNAEARAKCLALHGTACSVCGFDFERVYGAVAAGFIHVHHLIPIAEVGSSYDVDPETDLRPVCPNCHAVIHLGGGFRSIAEVESMLSAATSPN